MSEWPRWKLKGRQVDVEEAAALTKLFADLPAHSGAEMYRLFVSGITRQLLLMRPAKQRPKITGTTKPMESLAGAARSAHTLLDGLSPKAFAVLNLRPEFLRRLVTDLRVLEASARNWKSFAALDGAALRGRPARSSPSQATKIADAVADHYRGLTGKKASARDKQFVKLLDDVYGILRVRAIAASQAKRAAASQAERDERFELARAAKEVGKSS